MVCPNINSAEWKALEGKVGKKEAYRLWQANGFEVPAPGAITPTISGTEYFPSILSALRNSKETTISSATVSSMGMDDLQSSMLHDLLGARSMSRIDLIDELQAYVAHISRKGSPGTVTNIGGQWTVNYDGGLSRDFDSESAAKEAVKDSSIHEVFIGSKMIGSFDWIADDLITNIQGGRRVFLAAAYRVLEKVKKAFYLDGTQRREISMPAFFRSKVTPQQEYDRLRALVQESGIALTSIDHWQEMTGRTVDDSVNALADIANKLIAVRKDYNNHPEILAEEVAHLVIANQPSGVLEPMLGMVEQTQAYKDMSEQYMQAYNGDQRKVKMEVLGKLLAENVIKQMRVASPEPMIVRLLSQLRDAWYRFLEMFRPTPSLESYLEQLASRTLSGDINYGLSTSNDIFFNIDMRDYRNTFDAMIESIEQRINALRRRNQRTLIADQISRLEEEVIFLKEMRSTDSHAVGYIRFIEYLNEDLNEALRFVQSARFRTITVNASQIMQLGDFISYYEPYVDELEKFLTYGDVTIFSQQQIQTLSEQVRAIKEGFNKVRHFRDIAREDQFLKTVKSWWAHELGLDEGAPDFDQQVLNATGGYDIREASRRLNVEGNMMQWWFGSLRDAGDHLLRLIYAKVMRIDQKVHMDTLNFAKDLTNKLRELNIKNQDTFLEKEQGKRTGYYIDRTRRRAWQAARSKFFTALREKYGIPQDREARMFFMQEWKEQALANPNSDTATKYGQYRGEMSDWFRRNTVQKSDEEISRIIGERQASMSTEQYEQWRAHNIIEFAYPNGAVYTIYTGELSEPSDGRTVTHRNTPIVTVNWLNPAYARLQPNEQEFLNFLVEQKRMIDNTMLPGQYDDHQAPQLTDTMIDIIRRKRDRNIARKLRDNMVDEITVRENEDDVMFGEKTILRPDGSRAKYVPIYYTKLLGARDMDFDQRLDETDKISTDLVNGLTAYYEMASRWTEMSHIAPEMELIAEQAGKREFQRRNGERVAGSNTAIAKQLRTFIDMQVYGMKSTGGEQAQFTVPENAFTNFLGIGGKTMSGPKLFRQLGKYVRANNLGLNFFTTASNFIQSYAYNRIEDLVKQFTNARASLWGEEKFWKNIFHVISETGAPIKHNKMYLFMEAMGLQGDTRKLFENVDMANLSRRAIETGLYTSYELIEFWRSSRIMLAIMHNYRKASDGRYYNAKEYRSRFPGQDFEYLPNVFDITTVSADGKLQMSIPEDEFLKLASRVKFVAETIDGRLSPLDYAAAHQHFVAQLMTIHRGWLISGIQRRLKKKGINVATGDMEEGYWNTTASFMSKTFANPSRMQFMRQGLEEWHNLSAMEKENLQRMLWEFTYTMMAMMVAIIFNGLAEDDDDYMLDVAAYMSNRALMEIGAFVPPIILSEITNTLANPLVPMRQVELMFDFTDMFFGNEEIDRGQWKGYTKRERALLRLIPGVKGLSLFRDPNAANQFLKNKPLRSVPYEWYGK